MCVLQAIFAFEEASVVRADVRRERVLPEAHLGELVRRHAVGAQRDDPRLQRRRECCSECDDEFVGRAVCGTKANFCVPRGKRAAKLRLIPRGLADFKTLGIPSPASVVALFRLFITLLLRAWTLTGPCPPPKVRLSLSGRLSQAAKREPVHRLDNGAAPQGPRLRRRRDGPH